MSAFFPEAFADSQQRGVESEQKEMMWSNSRLDSLGRQGLELVDAKPVEI